jgi:hypothetical protein
MKQGDGTRTALADALATFSLGQVFNFIYRAAKDSAAYYQRGGVNKMQAANSTIGRISTSADRARANGWDIKSFGMPWNLPFSAIAETFFSKVMWQADMLQVPLRDAQPPAHAAAASNPEPEPKPEPEPTPVKLPMPAATMAYAEQYEGDRRAQPMRYALVTENGEITFGHATFQEVRLLVGADGGGETGMEFLPSLPHVTAYYYVPFDGDQRRMNKAANAMYWELTDPALCARDDADEYDDGDEETVDRVIKLRGPVAFIDRHNWGLIKEHETALKTAHQTAVARLRDRGWL